MRPQHIVAERAGMLNHATVPETDKLWSMQEAADYLRTSRTTLHRLKDSGELHTLQVAGTRKRLIPQSEIDRLLSEATKPRPLRYEPCIALNKDGSECRNRMASGSQLCGSHLRARV